MGPFIHVDFETYCDLNLKQVGGDRYLAHPSCELLMAAWAFDVEPVQQEVGRHPGGLLTFLRSNPSIQIAAFNARFERLAFRYLLGQDLPPERFYCVQAHAYALGFFGGLKDVGNQVGLEQDQKKLTTGTRLITKFCTPRKPTKHNKATRWLPDAAPGDWEEFKDYNVQDVVAEREIAHKFKRYALTPKQQQEYAWDQRVNDRGMPIDRVLVNSCVDLLEAEKKALHDRMARVTGVENPNSQPQLLAWVRENGAPQAADLTKATVQALLDTAPDGSPLQRTLLLRQEAAKTSPAKWLAIQRAMQDDNRLRGLFQLWGASRTGRWAGRIFQPHNLPWPSVPMHNLAEMLSTGNRDLVEALYDSVMESLVSGIRNGITAGPGKMLAVADLKSIESVLLGWMSGCTRLNAVYAEGRDAYRDFGSVLFNKPEEDITPAERKFAKPPTLGCGYKLSGKGLVEYAASMGVEMTLDEATRAVNLFREVYPEVVMMWDWLMDACMSVTEYGLNGGMLEGYSVRIYRDDNFLFIELPSGRRLCYYKPLNVTNSWGRLTFSYMGKSQYTGKWERIHTHGGKVTENIDQAEARDVLMHGMFLFEAAAGDNEALVGHVHDESIAEADADTVESTLEKLLSCMTATPSWAPGLKLGAEGFITRRYEKR